MRLGAIQRVQHVGMGSRRFDLSSLQGTYEVPTDVPGELGCLLLQLSSSILTEVALTRLVCLHDGGDAVALRYSHQGHIFRISADSSRCGSDQPTDTH